MSSVPAQGSWWGCLLPVWESSPALGTVCCPWPCQCRQARAGAHQSLGKASSPALRQLLSPAPGTAALGGTGWGIAQGSRHRTWLRNSYSMGQHSPCECIPATATGGIPHADPAPCTTTGGTHCTDTRGGTGPHSPILTLGRGWFAHAKSQRAGDRNSGAGWSMLGTPCCFVSSDTEQLIGPTLPAWPHCRAPPRHTLAEWHKALWEPYGLGTLLVGMQSWELRPTI